MPSALQQPAKLKAMQTTQQGMLLHRAGRGGGSAWRDAKQPQNFLSFQIERQRHRDSSGALTGQEYYQKVVVHLADLTVELDGNLIERVIDSPGPSSDSALRTVWLFRGATQALSLYEILQQQQQLQVRTEIRGISTVYPHTKCMRDHSGYPLCMAMCHPSTPLNQLVSP